MGSFGCLHFSASPASHEKLLGRSSLGTSLRVENNKSDEALIKFFPMEEDDEDKILLDSLGVTSVAPEAIERQLFLQARNGNQIESAESSKELDQVTDPSSSSCAKLYNKLKAVEVEISAVALSITEEKNETSCNDKTSDVAKKSVEPVQVTLDGLSLQEALAKDRLESLERTKARIKKEISNFEDQSYAINIDHEKLIDELVKDKPKNKKAEQSNRHSKRISKTVAYDEDTDFDAVLDAASAGFVETEREELIRKGKLTPFHKIKGFERRVELSGPSNQNAVDEGASNENFLSSTIAKAAQSMEDIARNRPSTKLLGLEALPVLDPPTRPFQRLRKPHKISPSEDVHEKKRRKLGKLKRPFPGKKQQKCDSQKEDFLSGDGDIDISIYDEENRAEASADDNQSCVILEGGLKIPNSVYRQLFNYQKVGVQWLWELHCQRAGGIIGDEMGLGKTIQVISFLGALHFSKMYKPSIIICPVTLLRQWLREIHKCYPHFNVEILHDSARPQSTTSSNDSEDSLDSDSDSPCPKKLKKSWDHVIDRVSRSEAGLLLTTYEQLRIHGEKLLSIEWGYAVLDEGHRIRNPNAEVTLVCKQLQTVHRIIMTGSPVQNKLSELWSLFDFVFPGKLGVLPIFEAEFAVPITVGGYANATPLQVSTAYRCAVVLRDLIMPYLLRRMKADVQAQLPKKTEHVLFCSLTREQRSVYRAFLASSEVEKIFDGSMNSLYGIDVMRKICNHPDLLEREHSHHHEDYGNPERSGKMKVVAQILKVWKEEGHRALFFTQTQQVLDIIERFLIRNQYSYRRMDGLTPVKHRMTLMDEFNNSAEIFVFILTTKVGGLGTNLTGANRVIIYDPDWNPSTDMQARERAWRIGQKRDVTVYRLITRGTIEEKVYHRQIYKHFLTNKVLKNPQQRRFFKAKDMKDLFTLQDEENDKASETLNIFGQLSGELKLEISNNQDERTSPVEGTSPGPEQQQGNVNQSNGAADEQDILKCLFDAHGIHSALNHDVIMNAHDDDKVRMEEQASRVAQRAAEALRESRMLRSRESFATPTWTGKSGAAGAPFSVPRKFGSTVNAQLLGSSRQTEGSSSAKFAAGSSAGKTISSAELLDRIRGRREQEIGDALEQDLGLVSRSSKPKVRTSRPPIIVQPEVMIRQLCTFIQQKGGEVDSSSITQHFRERIQTKDLPLFKSLLREIAKLEKDGNGARWVLKPDYQ